MGALTDKYCIVGVGETPQMRPSNRTTLSMACEAISNAMADAGLEPSDIDGMTSYQVADSTSSAHVATALGMRLNYCLDILGGGSSTEALVAHAIGLIEAGYAKTIVCFRSMNGRSGRRMGGQIPGGPIPAANCRRRQPVQHGMGLDDAGTALRHVRDALSTRHRLHDQGIRGDCGSASLSREPQSEGDLSLADHDRGSPAIAMGRQTVSTAGLLHGDRCLCRHHRDVARACIRSASSARLHHGRIRAHDDRESAVELLAAGAALRRGQLWMETRVRHGGNHATAMWTSSRVTTPSPSPR